MPGFYYIKQPWWWRISKEGVTVGRLLNYGEHSWGAFISAIRSGSLSRCAILCLLSTQFPKRQVRQADKPNKAYYSWRWQIPCAYFAWARCRGTSNISCSKYITSLFSGGYGAPLSPLKYDLEYETRRLHFRDTHPSIYSPGSYKTSKNKYCKSVATFLSSYGSNSVYLHCCMCLTAYRWNIFALVHIDDSVLTSRRCTSVVTWTAGARQLLVLLFIFIQTNSLIIDFKALVINKIL